MHSLCNRSIHKVYILSVHAVVGPGAPLISFGLCFILVLHMTASVWYVSVLFKYIYAPLLTELIHIRVHDLS